MNLNTLDIRAKLFLGIGFAFVLFFSSYHLFESPETWMDEGLIIQAATGILHTGKASVPVAPDVYEPLGLITTGFPLTLPLAGVFSVFGVSLEAARLVMLVFLLFFYIVLWFYTRKAIGGTAAWFGFFLLVFFGPLYGNGRNVLGEIPGLLFMLLALLPLLRSGELTRNRALLTGVGAGLAIATKPIFILFLPALILALFLRRRELALTKRVFFFGVVGVLVPLLVWVFFQFDHIDLQLMLAVWTNPQDINMSNAVIANLKRFVTEMQPLYFLVALVAWAVSYGVRRMRHEVITLSEEVLFFFSVLILLAYIRTSGYYRYFFPAQVFAILYLPSSIFYLARVHGRIFMRAAVIFLCGLVLFHAYETAFRSWSAVHYNSTRTAALKEYFLNLPLAENIFVYQAPEVMSFVGQHPTYQYDEITPSIRFGEVQAQLVLSGSAPRVITPVDFFRIHTEDIFSHYVTAEIVDNYAILILKETVK